MQVFEQIISSILKSKFGRINEWNYRSVLQFPSELHIWSIHLGGITWVWIVVKNINIFFCCQSYAKIELAFFDDDKSNENIIVTGWLSS